MTNEKIVTVFKAFSDESRVKILGLLKEGEMGGNAILEQMQIGQSTLSHHMKVLMDCGLVECRKKGTWTYYKLHMTNANKLVLFLLTIITSNEGNNIWGKDINIGID